MILDTHQNKKNKVAGNKVPVSFLDSIIPCFETFVTAFSDASLISKNPPNQHQPHPPVCARELFPMSQQLPSTWRWWMMMMMICMTWGCEKTMMYAPNDTPEISSSYSSSSSACWRSSLVVSLYMAVISFSSFFFHSSPHSAPQLFNQQQP